MASIESIRASIADAKGDILTLMQDVTEVAHTEWAEEMYLAHEQLEAAKVKCIEALATLDRAEYL